MTDTIKRNWHLIDAHEKILGKLSVEIAHLLMGKSKTEFLRNKDIGDFVVVINSKLIKTTGNKEQKKEYIHHTGYPQGLRRETLGELRKRDPRKIIFHAVKGMLPNNKLRDKMLKRLLIYPEANTPYQNKFK